MSRSPELSRPAAEADTPPVRGVRAAAKARSRRKLLESGKRLFMERGYEGATVRDIAAAAHLSTGAVFASFSDKADLFNEVLLADCPAQIELMDQKASESFDRVQDRLVEVLSLGYEFHEEQLPLMRAALGVSWSQGLTGELGDRPIRQAAVGTIRRLLEEGVASGQLKSDTDLDLVVDMVWDSYVANYRHALFGGWNADQLKARFRQQVEVLLAGLSARN